MSANGQPRAFFSAQSNFVFADELADVLEAHRGLMNALSVRLRHRVDHLGGRYAACRGHSPLARFHQVVVNERKNQVRLDPRPIAIHDSKTISVAVGRQTRSRFRIAHGFTQWRQVFFGDVRASPVEKAIALRSNRLHGDAMVA